MKKSVLSIYIFLIFVKISYAATYVVSSTAGNDYGCGGTPNGTNTAIPGCAGYANTLGWAIASANANPGPDVIEFNLPSGTIINVANPNWLLITDGNLTINATTGSMAAAWAAAGSCNPIIQITCGFSNGFDVNNVPGVTIRGLAFNMQGNCVTFRGAGVTSGTVAGCWAGLTLAGTATSANIAQEAIKLQNCTGVIIGGNSCALRNVLLANNNGGVYFDNADNCTVIGNYFNTRYDGTANIFNGGQACIRMQNGSTGNIIGTNAAGEGNVLTINGGQGAIFVESGSNNNIFRNNILGFAANGTTATPVAALGTAHGFNIDASGSGTIDNCTMGGFDRFGIYLNGTACTNWTITNNKIGTDITGNVGRRNKEGGIFMQSAISGVTVSGNVISGNGTNAQVGPGIQVESGCNSCTFSNNKIGIASNNSCLGNSGSGLFIKSTTTGTTITGNEIGCNGYANLGGQLHGIHTISCSNLIISNNYVGTVAANTNTQRGNNQDGIGLHSSTSTCTVQNNIVKYNNWGIFLQGGGGSHIIIGNTVSNNGFTNTPLAKSVLNEGGGICAQTTCNNNEIGRAVAGQGNLIDSNKCGIHLRGDPGGTTGNLVYNNTITRSQLGNYTKFATDYSGTGITVSGNSNTQKIGGTAALQPNTIYLNKNRGVYVDNSDFVEIRRNSIYCNGNTVAERSNPIFAIDLINNGNNNLTKPGPLTYAAPNGIANNSGIPSSITPDNITAGDVIEVYFDDQCGCQLKTYLGNATNAAPDWSYPAGGNPTPIPANGYCQIGGTKADGTPCTSAGLTSGYILTSVTATRTTSPGTASARTSEPMDCSPTTLPVHLISFTVKRAGNSSVLISWATSSEENNAYFEVLRSTDGKTFTVIGMVQGAGTTNLLSTYNFTDEGLNAGTYYYMLNQVDTDRSNQFSSVRAVSLSGDSDFSVFPTTVPGGDIVRILNFTSSEISSLSVIDISGKLVLQEFHIEGSLKEISTQGLSDGIYIIRIISGNTIHTEKIMVY
jgi:parallel beta-helix repeat protein